VPGSVDVARACQEAGVDMIAREIESFEPAFEHQALSQARRRVGGAS